MTIRYGIDFSSMRQERKANAAVITHISEAETAKKELLKAFDERDRQHFQILLTELFDK